VDFILKKVVSMFVMPLPFAMILFIVGLIFLYKHKLAKAKVFLTLSLLWLFLISYSPLVNRVLYALESSYATLKTVPKGINYIHVLGGGHHTDNNLPITSQVATASVVRLNEGIRLYGVLNGNAKLILSGYSGLYDPTPHSKMQKKLAMSLGVKDEQIITRPKPRDTQEEAVATKKIVGEEAFILVTSASHMRRAMNFFKSEGLHPIAAPTNHLAYIKHPNYSGFFSADAICKSGIIMHEVLGLIWQKIKKGI